jgi:hypothetical protein
MVLGLGLAILPRLGATAAQEQIGNGALIPAAVDDHSTGVSGGWYRAPGGWRASEHASEGTARRKRLLPTEADPFFMGQLQGRLV